MMKLPLCLVLIFVCLESKAQQFALFNTRTLFDAFENPAQRHFKIDESRKFSSNIFLPYFGITAANKGTSELFVRRLINEQAYNIADLPIGTGKKNNIYVTSNIYLFALKLFKSYRYNQELGLSAQLRIDGQATYTNESIAIFDSFRNFTNQAYENVFNTSGYHQSYYQFSLTYREDFDKRLSAGIKLSLLNGIAFNKLKIQNSYLNLNESSDQLDVRFHASYKSSFEYPEELSRKDAIPLFKHPGLSITGGFNYNFPGGLYVSGTLKDVGFIRWNKDSFIADVAANESFNNLNDPDASSTVSSRLTDLVNDGGGNKSFLTPTNAKADIFISKEFGIYKPALILSKNIFYKGGEIALVNTFSFGSFSGSITPAYNFNKVLMAGLQGMYKTENFEAFLGTDNLAGTATSLHGLSSGDVSTGSGANAASFYMGVGFKFGKVVQHPLASDEMPGIGKDKGFLQRLFKKN